MKGAYIPRFTYFPAFQFDLVSRSAKRVNRPWVYRVFILLIVFDFTNHHELWTSEKIFSFPLVLKKLEGERGIGFILYSVYFKYGRTEIGKDQFNYSKQTQ